MLLTPDDDYDILAAQQAAADAKRGTKKGKFKKSTKTDSDLEEEFDSLIPFDSSDEEEDKDEEGVLPQPARHPTVPDPSSPSSPSLRIVKSRGTGIADKVQLSGGAWVTNYEYQRLVQMGKNKHTLRAAGLLSCVGRV